MPTFQIPIALSWTGASGSPGANVWHGRAGLGDDGNLGLQQCAERLQTFYAALAPRLPSGMAVRFEGLARGVGDDSDELYQAPTWQVLGTAAGGYAPPALAVTIAWKTSRATRSGSGRTFIGPLPSSQVDSNGRFNDASAAIWQTAVDDLIDSDGSAPAGALGIYSRTEGIFRDLTAGIVRRDFASLRSRRD